MAVGTVIGDNTVTSIVNRYLISEITDNIYNSNAAFFRLNAANKKLIQGGFQIEAPLLYKRFDAGGFYTGLDLLDVQPSDNIKNGMWLWRQAYVPVSIPGLTLIQTDSPEAIVNFIEQYLQQSEMEMSAVLGAGVWSPGGSNRIDGFGAAVDDGGVAATYAGITRASNAWWNATDDSSTSALTLTALQNLWGSAQRGGRQPTIAFSRIEQYNRMWKLVQDDQTFFTPTNSGRDEQLAAAGFQNILFNGIPWVVDSNVFDGPNTSNSAIVFLNEDVIRLAVSPRADFYLRPFQSPVNQDAFVGLLLWAGNLVVQNCSLQGKLTNISS